MDFNLVDLKISIETDDPTSLRVFLFRNESAFATVCKQVACLVPTADCGPCRLKGDCPWHALFGQELSADPVAVKRHQKPPLPYVFSFNEPAQDTDLLECRLVVVGRAITHLSILLKGFLKLLSLDDFPISDVVQFFSRDYQGNYLALGRVPDIDQTKNLIILSANELADSSPWTCSRLGIQLLSPLKLLSNGKQLRHFEFGLFFRALMRRVSSLAYYYGGNDLDCDFKYLAGNASDIHCSKNKFIYESEPYGNKKLAGISGTGWFEGDFSGLMPIIVLGTYLHTGKKASFGLGCYKTLFDPAKLYPRGLNLW